MFCVNCGSALSAGAGGAPAAGAPMYPPAMPGLPSAWEADRRNQIGRTKTGLLLLLIGGPISLISPPRVFGAFLPFLAVLPLLLRRPAIGSPHAPNLLLALALYIR